MDDTKKRSEGERLQQRVDALFGAINASVQDGGEPLLSNDQMKRLLDASVTQEEKASIMAGSRFGDLVRESEAITEGMKSQRTTLWERCKNWVRRK